MKPASARANTLLLGRIGESDLRYPTPRDDHGDGALVRGKGPSRTPTTSSRAHARARKGRPLRGYPTPVVTMIAVGPGRGAEVGPGRGPRWGRAAGRP